MWSRCSDQNEDASEPPLKKLKASLPLADSSTKSLVLVDSTLNNLHRLELAVSDGLPVLLEGPIGCGKTTLVEHLAMNTMEKTNPKLIKLQLGDQMDCKALLGTYRCTDVPGQFVWQPGSLLSAVVNGHWLLLEDLDCAPMDVISILVPLLETGALSVPGHSDHINASPSFRLFATRRIVMSTSSWHRQRGSSSDLLDKLWMRIWVEPLSSSELVKVIENRFPKLIKSSQKLVEIYEALANRHLTEEENLSQPPEEMNVESKRRFISHIGRPISTRDLIKWCTRLERHVVNRHCKLTTDVLFVEAVDCFCASLPLSDGHVELAIEVGKQLNFSRSEVEHHCLQRQIAEPAVLKGSESISVGREILRRTRPQTVSLRRLVVSKFSFTRPALVLLERISVAIGSHESVLLVGETGTGKTSSVQYLSELMCHTLHVINMNQQSDSMDLLGGFKPVELQLIIEPLKTDFETLVRDTFPKSDNRQFFANIEKCFSRKCWTALFQLMKTPCDVAFKLLENGSPQRKSWEELRARIIKLNQLSEQIKTAPPFQFVEGTLVKALKRGDWILLDEINLASAELLECLSGLLESTSGSVLLTERGDVETIVRHPDFRLFACMNPATDVGKKDLPLGIRNRFTEMFVDELECDSDLRLLVRTYLAGLSGVPVKGIVEFYQKVRKMASTSLTDGTGRRPHYSLRTLCRALRQASRNVCGDTSRSVYEAFCLSFLTQLSRSWYPEVDLLIRKMIFNKSLESVEVILRRPLPQPQDGRQYVLVEGYWIPKGPLELPKEDSNDYILTTSVRANLRDLARIVSAGRLPVLLQGETSVGKTSLIKYLARLTGNICHRINNHEHTDIQEYIGCYTASEHSGRLAFREGVLVKAMRDGHWIILDELNLAPSDVLEALNRLLDDNRELRIPETQQVVQAKDEFVLFATQNPPGHYGGRKVLSRAFRNRFVELHFDEIVSCELEEILQKRCELPQSYSKILVQVMIELQKRRRASGLFTGKQGYMTLRDLFRWGERFRLATDVEKSNGKQLLAENGYMLLAGRVRHATEAAEIADVLEAAFKCKVDPLKLFTISGDIVHEKRSASQPLTWPLLKQLTATLPQGFEDVVWTYSMRRMALILHQALRFGEPVLLVGETGCGKTTVCQMYAISHGQHLRSVNCNLHTESSDFLGGLRPVRHHTEASNDDGANRKLFEWHDGPLVEAMKEGSTFLIDEISLADDSVLERLNSVLEPERTLLLTERGTSSDNDTAQIVALPGFRVVATMNPGGDYGKKELSPALRNRFTEIWCPSCHDRSELVSIIEHNLLQHGISKEACDQSAHQLGNAMLDFVEWFQQKEFGKKRVVTVRDLLAWVEFICTTASHLAQGSRRHLDLDAAFVHGACIVFVDCLNSQGDSAAYSSARTESVDKLLSQTIELFGHRYSFDTEIRPVVTTNVDEEVQLFGIPPFFISTGQSIDSAVTDFSFSAPSTHQNVIRVLRALQLPRPVLLEGSPGVGKTSLVAALAKMAGHNLVRINLSEQTDISDLFGADLPVEGGKSGEFAWRDGPFLAALRSGDWIVLDEMNLASQSVLEGLNACFDHRAEVFIPELGTSFRVERNSTRFFACQNPVVEGGGRKSLPRSFLNRFTQVYIDPLTTFDLLFITKSKYPQVPESLLKSMVEFNQRICLETTVNGSWGRKGGPWEFNLRDLFRWCDLLVASQAPVHDAGEFVQLIYSDRMRSAEDKTFVVRLFEEVFKQTLDADNQSMRCNVTETSVQVGNSFLPRKRRIEDDTPLSDRPRLRPLHQMLNPLKSLMKCVEMNWMAILVGGAGVGKSSLVELLANLTGNELHTLPMNSATDTTELLGGFEQADLRRDVEYLSTKIRQIVNGIKLELQAEHAHLTNELQSLWSECCNNVRPGGTVMTSSEEIKAVETKLASLKTVVECASSVASANNLLKLQSDCIVQQAGIDRVFRQLEETQSLNCGGQFVWIDSILVNCLRDGHWLLIDNVNFCSASVLDRLNALLEPGGSLVVSERGVIDGNIPTVRPHPDFRLILAMDPRHGELSRAMRNRGIEICMLGETDLRHGYDEYDVRLMIHDRGVNDYKIADVLVKLHSVMSEECLKIGAGKLFSVSHLLRAADLFARWVKHGLSASKALYEMALDVYVRHVQDYGTSEKLLSRLNSFLLVISNQENLSNISLDSLTFEWTSRSLASVWPQPLPSVDDWRRDTMSFASMQTTGALFLHLVSLSKQSDPSFFTSSSLDHRLSVALRLALENCPVNCIKSFGAFLRNAMLNADDLRDAPSCGVIRNGTQSTGCLPEVVLVPLEGVVRHPNLCRLEELAKRICNSEGIWNQNQFDWRWNAALMSRIKFLLVKSDLRIEEVVWQEMAGLSNTIYLYHQIAQHRVMISHMVEAISDSPAASRLTSNSSTLQLSLACRSDHSISSYHPCIGYVAPFIDSIISELSAFSASDRALDNSSFMMLIEQLDWLWRFVLIVNRPMEKRSKMECMAELAMHWNWLNDKFIVSLESIGVRMSSQLQELIYQLRSALGTDGKAAKVQEAVRAAFGHPTPFKHVEESLAYARVSNISRFLASKLNEDCASNNYCLGNNVEQLKLKIIRGLGKLGLDGGAGEALETAELLQKALDLTVDDTNCVVSSEIDCRVVLNPLFECLALHFEWQIGADLNANGYIADCSNLLQQFVEFGSNRTALPIMALAPWSSLAVKTDITADRQSCLLALFTNLLSKRIARLEHSNDHPLCANLLSLSGIVASLLSDDRTTKESSAARLSLPGIVTLGDSDSRLLQLSTLGRSLWINASLVSSDRWSLMVNNRILYSSVLRHLISTLVSSVPSGLLESLTFVGTGHISTSEVAEALERQDKTDSSLYALLPDWNLELAQCIQSLAKIEGLRNSDIYYDHMSQLGEAWVRLGLLQSKLLAPRGPVDPNYRLSMSLNYAVEDLKNIEGELDIRCWNESLLTGIKTPLSSSHPLIGDLYKRQKELTSLIECKSKLIAFRCDHVQFLRLLQDTEQFMMGLGSTERTLSLAEKLLRSMDDERLAVSAVQEQRTLLQSFNSFKTRIELDYQNYRDLTVPFLSSVAQTQHGLNLISRAVQIRSARRRLGNMASCELEDVMRSVGSFPSASRGASVKQTVDALVSEELHGLVDSSSLCETAKKTGALSVAEMHSGLLHSALLHTANWAVSGSCLDAWTVDKITTVFHRYVELWRDQEEARRQREDEEKSLYRYRTETFGDLLTEEERDENEIRSLFPSYEQEFEDFDSINFTSEADTNTVVATATADSERSSVALTDEDMNTVHTLHCALFNGLGSLNWHCANPISLPKIDVLQPLLLKYRAVSELIRRWSDVLDPMIERDLLGSHLLACSVLQTVIKCDSENSMLNVTTQTGRIYDVYRDSNVAEVVKCRSALDDLVKRIKQLLVEFPEWPTLIQVVRIVDRIKSFAVTSPLMRFVSGLEMVLQASQLWDRDAASSFKLTSQLEQVVKLIKHWRNIEYRCWKSCLNSVSENIRRSASRWWFHIYSLLETHIGQHRSDPQEQKSPSELLQALETFMESSSVGDYSTRLEMLLAFHCHLVCVTSSSDVVASMFWNVYQYYQQFQPSVEDFISKTRAEKEKSIQGTVKSVPWMHRDANYFNYDIAKSEMHKVHKSLHRDMKAFKQQLMQPVRPYLTDSDADVSAIVNTPQCGLLSAFRVREKIEIQLNPDCDAATMKRWRRMSMFCRRIMQRCKYTEKVDFLNSFSGELIDCVHELQSLKVDETRPKDKQKSDAKHITYRRRKALSDLFQSLESLGLSFKKGLAKLNMDSVEQMVSCFTVLPSCIVSSLKQLNRVGIDEWTNNVSDGCNKYFVRCIGRRRLFHAALETPSKELDHGTIERCRGFAEHLLHEVEDQRRLMAQNVNSFVELRKRMQSIGHLASQEKANLLPLQDEARELLNFMKETVNTTIHSLFEVELALNCAPSPVLPFVDNGAPLSPALPSTLSSMSSAVRGDLVWSTASDAVKESISGLQSIQRWLNSEIKDWVVITENDLSSVLQHVVELKNIGERLSRLDSAFCCPETGGNWFLGSAIKHIVQDLSLFVTRFESVEVRIQPSVLADSGDELSCMQKVDSKFNKVRDSVLLTIQVLYKNLPNEPDTSLETTNNEGDDDCDDDKVTDEVGKNVLTEHLGKDLVADMGVLKVKKITLLLDGVLKCALNSRSPAKSICAVRRLRELAPALSEYCDLVQFYVTHHIAGLRATAKLLSILLAIFSTLAQKGFCIPAEFSDDMEGEGTTKFEDIDGLGLGEGEGAKDVSEQIESEDQLEGSKQAGEKPQAKQENEQEVPAEDNAIEMTDDFDGQLNDGDKQAADDNDKESDSDQEIDETELDKQLGDLGEEECDKLDEQMWGSEDENEEDPETQDKKEELGPGSGPKSKPELGAKDDTGEQRDDGDQEKSDDKEDFQQPQPQCLDETEYDESEPTAAPPELPTPAENEAQLELPDDMNIDNEVPEEEGNTELDQENEGEMDLDKQLEDAQKETSEEKEPSQAEDDSEKPMEENEEKEADPIDEDTSGIDKCNENMNEDDVERNEEETGNSTDQAGLQAPADEKNEAEKKDQQEQLDNVEKVAGTEHTTTDVQQAESAQSVAGSSDSQDDKQEGKGISEADDNVGHEGSNSCSVTSGVSGKDQRQSQRKPGQSSENRSVGTTDEKVEKNLQTVDNVTEEPKADQETMEEHKRSSCYEHIRDARTQHDAQTMDTATEKQQQVMQRPNEDLEETDDKDITDKDFEILQDETDELKSLESVPPDTAKVSKNKDSKGINDAQEDAERVECKQATDIDGLTVATQGADRGPQSTIHTNLSMLTLNENDLTVDRMRQIVEEELQSFSRGTPDEEREAMVLWQHYDTLTSSLAQELCEQLRMVLAPTLAAKFKGGYRTGKRPCMRRVIEYIASDFRKDKFWLRRVEPSKRQYQVMVAIDDSASMVFNHSKQLAFESLSVITNALTKLEVGNIGVCSFGETTKTLHRLGDTFTSESGGRILRQLTFEQQKTDVAQLLDKVIEQMMGVRSNMRHTTSASGFDTSQLLLVVSDAHGLGDRAKLKAAVRRASEARVFLVFVVLENPGKPDIFKMTVCEFEEDLKTNKKVMKLSNYMETFPFPFYVVIRDVASLPMTLSDALRQWFELVTAVDR